MYTTEILYIYNFNKLLKMLFFSLCNYIGKHFQKYFIFKFMYALYDADQKLRDPKIRSS